MRRDVIDPEAAFKAAEARCIRFLEQMRREDPVKWKRYVQMVRLDRIIATEPLDSPIYAQALIEWRIMRGIDNPDGTPKTRFDPPVMP